MKIKELLTNQCISLKNEISKIDELELIHRSIKKVPDLVIKGSGYLSNT